MTKLKWNEAKKIITDKQNQDMLYFLEFTTTWCPDCKMMKPVVTQIFNEYRDNKNITFYEIDAEEAKLFRDINSPFKVLKVPAFVYFKNNQILKIAYEYYPKEILKQFIEQYID